MSFQPDIVASVLQELNPQMTRLFAYEHPLLRLILEGRRSKPFEGKFFEFAVSTGGPGAVTQVATGSEKLQQNLKQTLRLGNEYATRFIYNFKIPNKMLSEAESAKNQVAAYGDLSQRYGQDALLHLHELMVAQLVRGAASSGALTADGGEGLRGLMTLNGDQSYFPLGPASAPRSGFMQYAAPAAQTATVMGLPSEGAVDGVKNWANKYEHIGSASADLLNALRRTAAAASRLKTEFGQGGPDVYFADMESHLAYVNLLAEQVRTPEVTVDKVPKGTYDNRQGVVCQGGTMYIEEAIDLSDTLSYTTARVREGLILGLHCKSFEARTMGRGGEATSGWFEFSKAIPIPDEDAHAYRITCHLQLVPNARANQVAITGAALNP